MGYRLTWLALCHFKSCSKPGKKIGKWKISSDLPSSKKSSPSPAYPSLLSTLQHLLVEASHRGLGGPEGKGHEGGPIAGGRLAAGGSFRFAAFGGLDEVAGPVGELEGHDVDVLNCWEVQAFRLTPNKQDTQEG